MTRPSIRAVVFDMDGLMIDSERFYWAAGREVACRYGTTVADATLGRMMGRSPIDSMTIFATECGIAREPALLLDERDAMVREILARELEPMPGLMEVLEKLRPRMERLGVATSARRDMVDVVMNRVHIEPYFDAVQTSDDVTHGKPNPEIYHKAMARLGVPPAECVVLEDSSNGALAGRRSGAYVIAVPSEHTRDQDFSFVDAVATDLRDAARQVLELRAAV